MKLEGISSKLKHFGWIEYLNAVIFSLADSNLKESLTRHAELVTFKS